MSEPKDDLEFINLASELSIGTEEKNPVQPLVTETKEEEKKEDANDTIPLNKVISLEESSEYLVTGVDAILTLAGGAFYSIKGSRILNAEQKKIVSEAKKKPESARTEEELHLINFHKSEIAKIQEKSKALDLTEKEIAKLQNASRGMIKTKNWKVGPDFAFWITLTGIISDRAIDAFMED